MLEQYFDVKLAFWECWYDSETKSKTENNRIANVGIEKDVQ